MPAARAPYQREHPTGAAGFPAMAEEHVGSARGAEPGYVDVLRAHPSMRELIAIRLPQIDVTARATRPPDFVTG